jgi:RimJ/RimL family protein N-acetyltransferase
VTNDYSWPLYGLTVTTPHLQLRYATDADLQELARFRDGRVVRAGEEPFDGDSSFYASGPEAGWKAIAGEWGARARTSPDWWHLSFAAVVRGEIVGQQNITAPDFRTVRTVNSFSFLDRAHRRRGLGTEMRRAVLHLAFAGLGARRAESDAFADNAGSIGVSRRLGYRENGTLLAPRPSGAALMVRFLLTAEQWERTQADDIVIDGLAAGRSLLGLDTTSP